MNFACFLRGINVSGHNIIKMAELREVLRSAEFEHVTSYIQSGNLVFSSDQDDPVSIGNRLEQLIEKHFDVKTRALIFDEKELGAILMGHPRTGHEFDTKKAYYVLLDQPIINDRDSFKEWKFEEQIEFGPSCLYLYYPNGYGRSKVTLKYLEKLLGTTGTARNFRTMTKMLELIKSI